MFNIIGMLAISVVIAECLYIKFNPKIDPQYITHINNINYNPDIFYDAKEISQGLADNDNMEFWEHIYGSDIRNIVENYTQDDVDQTVAELTREDALWRNF